MAVRGRIGDFDGAGKWSSAATGLVYHRGRHAVFGLEVLGDHSRQHILEVAGRPGNHEGNRSLGIFGLGCCGPEEGGEAEDRSERSTGKSFHG